jgi:hypothetical protein
MGLKLGLYLLDEHSSKYIGAGNLRIRFHQIDTRTDPNPA